MIPHSKPWINKSDQEALAAVLRRGMIAQGEQVRLLERSCASYLGVPDGVAMGSGTAALMSALIALELAKESEVILPTYVCKNVAEAVFCAGYLPVLCDVGNDWNMTPEGVAKVITERTGAIIIVHLFGIPVQVDGFEEFGLPLIEDACQAFGAEKSDRKVGTLGTVGVFSFHATKCLTTGEGGLTVSNDRRLLEKMRKLRDGEDRPATRLTSPMSDLQAALGISQLSQYDRFLKRRRLLAGRYYEALSDCPVRLPDTVREESIFFRFPVRVHGDFNSFQQRFAEQGVYVRHGVDSLLHSTMNTTGEVYPNAEQLMKETISLPIYPALTDDQQDAVIRACRRIWCRK